MGVKALRKIQIGLETDKGTAVRRTRSGGGGGRWRTCGR